MTDRQLNQFLAAVVIICAFGAMLNLSKIKTRGQSAKLLAAAFCSFGFGVFLMRMGASLILIALAGGVTFALLAADFVYRLGKGRTERR